MPKTVYVTVKLTVADEADVNEVLENIDYNFSYIVGSPPEGEEKYFSQYGEAILDTEIVETEVK
jgi:hypothetical protein